ncbi:hypothetical protein J6590_018278 [Homalodisca vitripennis]|nr:hypothetical protein J6590_018278 [Homalodisca vitripennis]
MTYAASDWLNRSGQLSQASPRVSELCQSLAVCCAGDICVILASQALTYSELPSQGYLVAYLNLERKPVLRSGRLQKRHGAQAPWRAGSVVAEHGAVRQDDEITPPLAPSEEKVKIDECVCGAAARGSRLGVGDHRWQEAAHQPSLLKLPGIQRRLNGNKIKLPPPIPHFIDCENNLMSDAFQKRDLSIQLPCVQTRVNTVLLLQRMKEGEQSVYSLGALGSARGPRRGPIKRGVIVQLN